MQQQLDSLTNKFNLILNENNQLREKLDKTKSDFNNTSLNANEKSDLEKIKHQALLVLEENKMLAEQNEMKHDRMIEIQKQHIYEGYFYSHLYHCNTLTRVIQSQLCTIKTKL